MVIFCLCLEPFLRALEVIIGEDAYMGAFADDVGVVSEDIISILRPIANLFGQLASCSNMKLNLLKCTVVPLSPSIDLKVFAGLFKLAAPEWAGFQVNDHAEYLGLILGPGSTNLMWLKPIRKAYDTIARWKNVGAGFFFNLLAANIYILP